MLYLGESTFHFHSTVPKILSERWLHQSYYIVKRHVAEIVVELRVQLLAQPAAVHAALDETEA